MDQVVYCCTDTEVSAKSFINTNFVKRYKLPTIELTKLVKLRLANRDVTGVIIYTTRTILAFSNYLEELFSLVTLLSKFDMILGMPWMELYDPQMSFK